MTIQTNFIKASTRKEAIIKSRAKDTIESINALNTKAFKVTDWSGNELLALITDVVTGQGSENIFKVEIDVYPK